MKPGMVLEDPGEVAEILATPEQTGDRYQLRLTIAPGGGPGLRGPGVHSHPGLIEIFRCVSGEANTRVGHNFGLLLPGEELVVPAGVTHGLKNKTQEPVVIDADLVFTPPGPRPEADLVSIGVEIAASIKAGNVSRWSGYPPILHMAVVESAHPEAMKHIGLLGLIQPRLAALGRFRGYKYEPASSSHLSQ